jgi:hypothetical protein
LTTVAAALTKGKAQGYVTKSKSSHRFIYFNELLLIAIIP